MFSRSGYTYFYICNINVGYSMYKYTLSTSVYSYLLDPENHILAISQYTYYKSSIALIDYISNKTIASYRESSSNFFTQLHFGNNKKQIFFYVSYIESLYLYDFNAGRILNEFSLNIRVESIAADYQNRKIYIATYYDSNYNYNLEQYSLEGFHSLSSVLNYKNDPSFNRSEMTLIVYIKNYNYLITGIYSNIKNDKL